MARIESMSQKTVILYSPRYGIWEEMPLDQLMPKVRAICATPELYNAGEDFIDYLWVHNISDGRDYRVADCISGK